LTLGFIMVIYLLQIHPGGGSYEDWG
jgi:hypothetical protein